MEMIFMPTMELDGLHVEWRQTYEHHADDGTIRIWDATTGMEIAADGRASVMLDIKVMGLTPLRIEALYRGLDREHALGSDLTKPILAVPFFGELLIIDGWHRLWKAAYLGVAEIPTYLLTQYEANQILCACYKPEEETNDGPFD